MRPMFAKDDVLRLNRALYGLVQSPRAWLKHFVEVLTKCGLTACESEPCVMYQRTNGKLILIVVIYVDDCILAGLQSDVNDLKKRVQKYLVISDLGRLRKHLGVAYEFGRDEYGPYLAASMPEFRDEIVRDCVEYLGKLRDFPTPGYSNVCLIKHTGEPVMQEMYRSIVGKVLYLVKKVEPNCANSVRELSSFLDGPGEEHWKSVARLAGYLSQHYRPLKMRPPTDLRIRGCVDSDWASDRNDRKSIGGYLLTIGDCLVDWSSKKQATVALSSTEAEYMAYSDAACSVKYLHMLVTEVMGDCPRPAVLHEDNTGAIHLLKNDHIGKRTKHIDVRYRFVNNLVREGLIVAEFIRSEENAADIMTKNIVEKLFVKHSENIYEGRIFRIKDEKSGRPTNKEDVKERALVESCDVIESRTSVIGPKVIELPRAIRPQDCLVVQPSERWTPVVRKGRRTLPLPT
jgi:Reverse transcriptase (RNA-dependent DNA polymerase)